jgi:hypothetical protein
VRFAIRDDDTSYFTRPEDLEQVYRHIWDSHPVSLGVVPFHGCARSGAIPEVLWSGEEAFPLDGNPALVSFLKGAIEKGRVSILLHGFDHVDRQGHPEFSSDLGRDELARRLAHGRRYLEDLLATTINTFVPPHNEMSPAALGAIEELALDVLGTFSFRPNRRPLSASIVQPMLRRRLFLWRQRRRGWRGDFYPFPLHVEGHREMACHNLNRDPLCSLEDLLAKLDQTCEVGGDFCLATHYWELRDPLLAEWLERILQRATAAGARFVHADALFAETEAASRGEIAA